MKVEVKTIEDVLQLVYAEINNQRKDGRKKYMRLDESNVHAVAFLEGKILAHEHALKTISLYYNIYKQMKGKKENEVQSDKKEIQTDAQKGRRKDAQKK